MQTRNVSSTEAPRRAAKAPGPESTLLWLSPPGPPLWLTPHTQGCARGPQDTGSTHASRHPETSSRTQGPVPGATQGCCALGAVWKDGDPWDTGVIGQDCLAAPTLGSKVPEDTQHTDLKPKDHCDPLGSNNTACT